MATSHPDANPVVSVGKDVVSVGREVADRIKYDYVLLTAAGVAFFAFLAIIPTLVALVAVYGLVSDPTAIEQRVGDLTRTLPEEVRSMLVQQLKAISSSESGALTVSLVVSLALALWSASSGMGHLIGAVNIAYGKGPPRSFVPKRLLGLTFTVGGVVFAAVAIGTITALPAVLAAVGITGRARWLLTMAAWPVVGIGLVLSLAVLYRFAPNRSNEPRWRFVSPGAILATVAWLLASIGFQVYVANFGSFNETYGSLGAIVVLLMWIWISATVILVGAVVNHILEGSPPAVAPG